MCVDVSVFELRILRRSLATDRLQQPHYVPDKQQDGPRSKKQPQCEVQIEVAAARGVYLGAVKDDGLNSRLAIENDGVVISNQSQREASSSR